MKLKSSTVRIPEPPADADALRALAWLDRGGPDSEIVYDDAVPKQTRADLTRFRPASYIRRKD